ncbi:MAG: thioredoxin family protein [Candidatus Falkowbacteria bacterium]
MMKFKLKKAINLIIIGFFLLTAFNPVLAQDNKVYLYFFYGDGCPHCAKEEKLLDKLEEDNSNIIIKRYEVWKDRDNARLLSSIAKELNLTVSGVPFLIIGDETVSGYYNEETTGAEIKSIVFDHIKNGCNDIVAPLLNDLPGPDNGQCIHGCDPGDAECIHNCGCETDVKKEIPDRVNIPILGEVEVKNLSLPLLTFIIAAADGFNPCAMWVLLFLISLLLGMENKKRMWILGTVFIAVSGAVYFLFLAAWLNLFLFLGFVTWIRAVVGLIALLSGGYHLYDYYRHRDGTCRVTDNEKRKKVFDKLRTIVLEKKFVLALSGIILLAAAVNLVELVCSAGLPAVYTQVIALAGLPSWQYYGYLLLYILIFMLDDLLIFFIAMFTLRMKAISSRYTRWSNAIGGIIMLVIGLLLLFKPGWIMFG